MSDAEAKRLTCTVDCAAALNGADKNKGTEPTKPPESGGDKPFDMTAFVATVMGVVLAVVTLIATKTASDARNDVRAEIAKLDAASRQRGDAHRAHAAMLSTLFMTKRLALRVKLTQTVVSNRPATVTLTRLIELVGEITTLLYASTRWGHVDADTAAIDSTCRRCLDLLKMAPINDYDFRLIDDELRLAIREAGRLIFERQALLRESNFQPIGAEAESWNHLNALAGLLSKA